MATEELTARYVGTVFRADDDSCVICRVEPDGGPAAVVKGPPDAGPPLLPHVRYRFHGRWQEHEKYGRQFAFAAFSACVPSSRQGTLAYLEAIAPGVGPARAAALWERYGPLAVPTLRESPEAVAKAGLLPPDVARVASETLHREGAFEATKIELMGLLAGRGFQMGRVIPECLALWGPRAPDVIRRNPYALLLRGVTSAGWARADRLYLDLGLPPDRLKRQALCAVHALDAVRGDTWVTARSVGRAVERAVQGPALDPVRALRLAIRAGLICRRRDRRGEVWLALAANAGAELRAAVKTKELTGWTETIQG